MGRPRHLESCLLLCHAVEADEVTQKPAGHVASLEWRLLQCAKYVVDGRERKAEQFENYEERWDWRLESREELASPAT